MVHEHPHLGVAVRRRLDVADEGENPSGAATGAAPRPFAPPVGGVSGWILLSVATCGAFSFTLTSTSAALSLAGAGAVTLAICVKLGSGQ